MQRLRANVRRYPNGWGEAAPLTGLLYCADCGAKMYVHRTRLCLREIRDIMTLSQQRGCRHGEITASA